jgi:hypothetical protein
MVITTSRLFPVPCTREEWPFSMTSTREGLFRDKAKADSGEATDKSRDLSPL